VQTNLRKLTVVWPLVMLLLLPALTRAETAVQAWVQRYNGPGNGWDQATALAVDGSNNVIVTGYSSTSGSFLTNDYATIKYSGAGEPLWTNRYNVPGGRSACAYAVAVDGSNNVIVTGYSTGSGGDYDYATIKYSSAGVPLWTNRYNVPGGSSACAYAVAVDGSNNVIVTGWSAGGSFPDDYGDYATIKYSSAGVPLWTNRYNGPGNGDDGAYAVAVDGSNNVIVTGGSWGIGGNDTASAMDYATIKYSSTGMPLWTNRYDGPVNEEDEARAVAVDSSNNVIVTGYSSSTNHLPFTDFDYATIKYSSDGVPLWTNRYNGPGNVGDEARAVAVDGSNNVIVTGSSISSSSGYDYATIKYSSDGVPLWTNRYNGRETGYDVARALAVDGSNNVIVSGYSNGSGSGTDYATIKYSSAGAPLWISRYNGPGNSSGSATAVAVDRSGNVIVTGPSYGSKGDVDFATIKYICVPSPLMTGLQRTNGAFHIRVEDVLQPGTLVIEASTNLAGWAPVFTNTTPTNVLFYTDPETGNYRRRFYRAFQFP
jgi:uncharacterized delta-60 repeat protein